MQPAEAPGCSQGTPYSFWVKDGDPSKVVVIFSGGGACWSAETCALSETPSYRPFAGPDQNPSEWGGVFDTDNPENPLADYSFVFLPTCNGDVFLGDSITTYATPTSGPPADTFQILHEGYDNAMSALTWMFGTYRNPETVAVLGWSAGAIASPVYTHIVAQHYPDAAVSHFGDGAGAYRVGERLEPLFESWGIANALKNIVGFEDMRVDGLSLEDLYIRAAELHPDIIFHQYNERHDAIQALFMRLMGVDSPDVPANLDDAHAYIRAHVSNFRTYTSWGHDEGIIGGYYDGVLAKNALENRGRPYVLDRLYTYQTNGVRFLDWFTAAVRGQPVEDVTCEDCETPEYHWQRPRSAE
ncbi:MAG TPA: pectin acetylesterase-family hydrolase [Polyangiaceae bacterium]|nr:pectin acetylesterase-family hydrolase [Polyangiaceae bacterium]